MSSSLFSLSRAFRSVSRPFSTSACARVNPVLPGFPIAHPGYTHESALAEPRQLDAEKTQEALSLLKEQPQHYVVALVMGRRYILTKGDVLTIPKLKGVAPGDELKLTRVLEAGSRDFTLRPSVPASENDVSSSSISSLTSDAFTPLTPVSARSVVKGGLPRDTQRHPDSLPYLKNVHATALVTDHSKGKMFTVEKFKRRKGYRRTLRSKLEFTRLKIKDIVFA